MDNLDDLPIDHKRNTSEEEVKVLHKYLTPTNSKSSSKGWVYELKIVAIATALFLLMTTEFFDKCLNFLPYTEESPGIKLGMKGLIYAVSLYILMIMTS